MERRRTPVPGPVRAALDNVQKQAANVQKQAAHIFPIEEIQGVGDMITDTGDAIKTATGSIGDQVDALGNLTSSIQELLDSVRTLSGTLGIITDLLAPVVALQKLLEAQATKRGMNAELVAPALSAALGLSLVGWQLSALRDRKRMIKLLAAAGPPARR